MFSREKADAVCQYLAQGKSLRASCKLVGDLAPSSVLEWKDKDEGFAEQYARARQTGYQLLADEILDISDDGSNDSYTDEDGNERTNQDVIARSRLRVDSRKWMLAKMLPKVYGEKIEVDNKLSGNVGHTHELSGETASLLGILSQGAGNCSPEAPVQD